MDRETTKLPEDARQGRAGVGLRYVLGFSLGLALIAIGTLALLHNI